MRNFYHTLVIFVLTCLLVSCTSTKELTIQTINPSPVDFPSQIKRIGIVNAAKSTDTKSYSTRLEQMIVLEERWLAKEGTAAVLAGLFDELVQDQRFDTILILGNLPEKIADLGTTPTEDTWKAIATLCEENDLDAIFSLAFL